MVNIYIPNRGDIVYLDFNPTKGHEQRGYRPALIISPAAYSEKISLALFFPITSQQKGYPFEVLLPEGLQTRGVILVDQIRSLDLVIDRVADKQRNQGVLEELKTKIYTLAAVPIPEFLPGTIVGK